jgi:HK97 family phage major capsid protein
VSYKDTNGAQGGVLVPASFSYEVDIAQKYYAPMLTDGVCRVISTETGAVLPFPTNNDTSNVAAVLADAVQDSEVAPTFSVVNYGAYKYSSKIVRVAVELMQDSAINIESFLKDAFAERFGRGFEAAFTTGAGSTAPTGILTAVLASGATPVIASGSSANTGGSETGATSIGTVDLTTLEHSVDPAYRRRASYMLSDNALKTIKTLIDKFGRPLWQPSLSSGAPATIMGYPYVINQSLPTVAATHNSVLFGDMSKFIIRKVRDISVLRLDERYADYGQVGFIAFSRVLSR